MISLNDLQPLFSLLRERFEENQTELNALDSAVGDGDHGFTMTRALRAAEAVSSASFLDLGAGFDAVADAVAENAGGAIGPLLGAIFAEGGIVLARKQELDLDDLLAFLEGGLAAVQQVGGARPGDKTLVDALAGAVDALKTSHPGSLEIGLRAAASGAAAGAESTSGMTAAHGRASFVAERSLGHQDAGATSLALILQTLADFETGSRASSLPSNREQEFQTPDGKLVNHPDLMVQEDNQGLTLLFPRLVKLTPEGILVRSNPKEPGKVGLVIGHGGGHTPSMGGFVGPGLLDADVYGPIFTCASGVSISRAIQAAEHGAGVALLISNHSGDVLNAKLALRRARAQGILVEPILLSDDVATAPRESFLERRGLGGLLFALKAGGGAAEAGKSLSEVADLMRKTNQRTATLSVAVRPPTHPATGLPLFELTPGQIEIGTGVHGEVGVYRGPHLPASDIIRLLLDRLVPDLEEFKSRDLLVFINGAGGTSQMELNILYRDVLQQLESRGLEAAAGVADSFFTTQEMGGFSLSLCAADQEILSYWELPAKGPAFRWPYW